MARVIGYALYIDWDFDTVYTDESSRLISASGNHSFAAPETTIEAGNGMVATCSIVLDNSDGRYSPLYTSSPLYSVISDGRAYNAPMYLTVSLNGGTSYRVFTGVIKIPQETGPTYDATATVTIECRGNEEIFMNARASTPSAEFISWVDTTPNEAMVIAAILDDLGVDPANTSIDGGLFGIPYPWMDDASPIETAWRVAASCGGRFYCNVDGVYCYENATKWVEAPHRTSQQTLVSNDWETFTPQYNDKELYETISVTLAQRQLGASITLWEIETPIVLRPGETKRMTAKLKIPTYIIDSQTLHASNGGGLSLDDDIDVTRIDYAQRSEFTITNTNVTYSAIISTFNLIGKGFDTLKSAEVTETSVESFWTPRGGRTRQIRDNQFLQTLAQGELIATFLRDRHQLPRLQFKLEGVPGNPVRRIGDRITVNDTDLMSSSRAVFVISIDWTLSEKGFIQQYNTLDATNLFPHGDTTPGYFVIGTNKLGSTDPLKAHLFY